MIAQLIRWGAMAALITVIGGASYFFYELKITSLQRDLAQCQNSNAQTALKLRTAEIAALNKTMEQNDDRNNFITQNALEIERARQNGDGAISPVLRDALERVRDRYRVKSH